MRDERVLRASILTLSIGIVVPAAHADLTFNWDRPSDGEVASKSTSTYVYGQPNAEVNDRGGTFFDITTTFDESTQKFSWSVTFGRHPVTGENFITDGFWIVVTPGNLPISSGGQVAQLFFDNTSTSPILSGYGYNGLGNQSSFFDGSGQDGVQAPDRIFSSINDPGIVQDISVNDLGGDLREFQFALDATVINTHVPKYPGSESWQGIQFGERIGIWIHPVTQLSTNYQDGYLTQWEFAGHGWWDGVDLPVPAPGALAILLLAGLTGPGRRRR